MEALFTRAGGAELRQRIDGMTNPEYQRLLRSDATELRRRLPGAGPGADRITDLISGIDDATLVEAVANLGGHDLAALDNAFTEIDDTPRS